MGGHIQAILWQAVEDRSILIEEGAVGFIADIDPQIIELQLHESQITASRSREKCEASAN